MKRFFASALICLLGYGLAAQGFEIVELQDSYKGTIGEVIKAPLQFKNNSSKPLTLIIRKANSQIGTSQKNYFCIDGRCLDQKVEDYIVKVDPGQTLTTLNVALEAGLVPGVSSVKYIAYNKSNPGEALELEFHFVVEEKLEKNAVYSSQLITVRDLYPNPVTDFAYLDYKVLDDQIKAKIILHNVLGNPVGEYELPLFENKMKIPTSDLNAGIYFYTLYIDGEGVYTKKLIKQ